MPPSTTLQTQAQFPLMHLSMLKIWEYHVSQHVAGANVAAVPWEARITPLKKKKKYN